MTSPISASTYNAHIKGRVENNQNRMVLDYLRLIVGACSIRMLHKLMTNKGYFIDIVSLRRSVSNLTHPDPHGKWHNEWNKAKIRVAYESKCPITNKVVGWYEPIECADQLSLFK